MDSSANYRQIKIFFEGNSLTALAVNSITIVGGQYVANTAYATVILSKNGVAMTSYAVSGRSQTDINASVSTNITPYVKQNDIIFLWEGTNDLNVNGASSAQAWTNVLTYINSVSSIGVKLIIGTVIARDKIGDAADLMTRIDEYNTLVRDNAIVYNYTVCDLGADPLFDVRADASNATYYNGDKVHLATAGQNTIAALISTSIISLIP